MSLVQNQILLLSFAAVVSLFGFFTSHQVPLSAYLLIWAIFHSCEYLCTAMYLRRTLTPYSFLVYGATGSTHLMAVHLLSIMEHIVTSRRWGNHGQVFMGIPVSLAGIAIRDLAIKSCGDSFSHYIETQGTHRLVTNGIYSFCRHPSYLGFLIYVLGMQMILGNKIMLVFSFSVLAWFFFKRIRLEEWFLVHRIFGEAYVRYQQEVPALIPGIY